MQEGPGFFTLGPTLAGFIDYFEKRLLEVAAAMGAQPYRFPALISPGYMERVQYF